MEPQKGAEALKRSLKRAFSSIRHLRIERDLGSRLTPAIAFQDLQAPEPLQQEPDALIADWGQLGHDRIDYGGGSVGLTGICPIAPGLSFILPDKGDFILQIPVAETASEAPSQSDAGPDCRQDLSVQYN